MPFGQQIYIFSSHDPYSLRFQTLKRYLPYLAEGLRDGRYGQVNRHGIVEFDIAEYSDQEVPQMCLKHVLKHLHDVDRSNDASSYLPRWLERKFARSGPALTSQPFTTGRPDITEIFVALGRMFSDYSLGCNYRIFYIMSVFFLTHSDILFKYLPVKEAMNYVLALDGMGKDMTIVLERVATAYESGVLRASRKEILRVSQHLRLDTYQRLNRKINSSALLDRMGSPHIGGGWNPPSYHPPVKIHTSDIGGGGRLAPGLHSTERLIQWAPDFFKGDVRKLAAFAKHYPDRVWVDAGVKRADWPRAIRGEYDWSDEDDFDLGLYDGSESDYFSAPDDLFGGGYIDERGFPPFDDLYDNFDEGLDFSFLQQHDWRQPMLLTA